MIERSITSETFDKSCHSMATIKSISDEIEIPIFSNNGNYVFNV